MVKGIHIQQTLAEQEIATTKVYTFVQTNERVHRTRLMCILFSGRVRI